MNIRIAICGYGNLGKGAERAALAAPDIDLVAIFTRRPNEPLRTLGNVPALPLSALRHWKNRVDVLLLCGGSATDLPRQTPTFAADFNTVDSFDTHEKIPAHFAAVDRAARSSGHLALISAGWDPGLFSAARSLFASVLPNGENVTFWGRGVSQGHSDAIRRLPGVRDAREYTVPIPEAAEQAEHGQLAGLTPTKTHRRECYVVAEDGANRAKIERDIRTMPNYFQGYETTVTFVTQEELTRDHSELPHGGRVIRSGKTAADHTHTLTMGLQSDSNPPLTGSVLVACSRAVARLRANGTTGCITPLDLSPALLSPLPPDLQRKQFL